MRELVRFLKAYKKESILAPLFKLLEATLELFVPIVMAYIIDKGIASGDNIYILKMGAILLLIATVGLSVSLTAQYFAAKAAVGFSTDLRHELFDHIQKLSLSDIDRVGSSTLITRLTSDLNRIQSGVNLVLRLFLRSPFIVIGAMIMSFTIDAREALVFVIIIPLLAVVVFGCLFLSIPVTNRAAGALDKLLQRVRENLSGVRVLRGFKKQDDERGKFATENALLHSLQMLSGRIMSLMNPLTYILINMGIIILLHYGALDVYDGEITKGELVALINYMSQILIELIKLANLIISINNALSGADRIKEIFDIKCDKGADISTVNDVLDNISDKDGEIIRYDHVSLTYPGAAKEALTDIDFSIKKGETIGIIGGTGAGKTSIVSILPGMYDVTGGNVYIFGKDIRTYDKIRLRDRIGMVEQRAVLFSGTVRDNLLWGDKKADDKKLWEALRIAQAEDIIKDKKDGLNYYIERDGRNLSGGQRQRLCIARALVKDPDILILDDSSSALDRATDAALKKALSQATKDKTLIIISQRISSVENADKIVVLDDGQISGIGTHDKLIKSCDVYKEIAQAG